MHPAPDSFERITIYDADRVRERVSFKNRPSPRPGCCFALSRRTKKERERERGEIERERPLPQTQREVRESRRVSCQFEGFEPIKDRKKQRRLG